jgi:hypothetical protein
MSEGVVLDQEPNPMQEMRVKLLRESPAEYGIAPDANFPHVYGVLMDWPIDGHTATVVSLCDGTASLYTTSTFGIIGGGGHEHVRREAVALVRAAAAYCDEAVPAQEFPNLPPMRVRFYLLTFNGVIVIECDAEAVMAGRHRMTPLFAQGQAVLTQLRHIMQARDGQSAENTSSQKQRSGAARYLNCLLTVMSETAHNTVEIVALKSLPNLLELASEKESLRSWIESQAPEFAAQNAKDVIRLLKQSAKITGLPVLTQLGQLPVVHAREDGGALARIFEIRIKPFSWSTRIDRLADTDPASFGCNKRLRRDVLAILAIAKAGFAVRPTATDAAADREAVHFVMEKLQYAGF